MSETKLNVHMESAYRIVAEDGRVNSTRGVHYHACGKALADAFSEMDAADRKVRLKDFDRYAESKGSTIKAMDALAVYALTEDGDYSGLRKLAPAALCLLARELAGVDRKKWRPVPKCLRVDAEADKGRPASVPGWTYCDRDRCYVFDMRQWLDVVVGVNGEGAPLARIKKLVKMSEAGEHPLAGRLPKSLRAVSPDRAALDAISTGEMGLKDSVDAFKEEALAALAAASPAAAETLAKEADAKEAAQMRRERDKLHDMAEKHGLHVGPEQAKPRDLDPMDVAAVLMANGDIFTAKVMNAFLNTVGLEGFASVLPRRVVDAIAEAVRAADAKAESQAAESAPAQPALPAPQKARKPRKVKQAA